MAKYRLGLSPCLYNNGLQSPVRSPDPILRPLAKEIPSWLKGAYEGVKPIKSPLLLNNHKSDAPGQLEIR